MKNRNAYQREYRKNNLGKIRAYRRRWNKLRNQGKETKNVIRITAEEMIIEKKIVIKKTKRIRRHKITVAERRSILNEKIRKTKKYIRVQEVREEGYTSGEVAEMLGIKLGEVNKLWSL